MMRSLTLTSIVLLSACGSPPQPEAPAPKEEAPSAEKVVDPRYQELPTPGPAPAWAPPSASKHTLENGLSVWHMEHGTAPLVSIHLMLPAGSAADPDGKAGLTLMAADLLDEGAGKLSALELSDKLGELATDYQSRTATDYTLLSMDALAENLDQSLAVLADIVLRPKLDKEEFERRKAHHVATAMAGKDDPRQARGKAIAHAMFKTGYASRPATGTVDSLQSITYLDVRSRAKAMSAPEGAHLVIAGSADQGAVVAAVEKHFAKWIGKPRASEPEVAPAPTGGKVYVVDFPGAAQSSLAVVMRASKNGTPNFFAEEVMNHKLGGSFTGRINMNLREDKGFTYGARSGFARYNHAGYFSISADVNSGTTGASVSEIFSELKSVCADRPLTDAERQESVDGMLLGFPLDFDTVHLAGYRLASLPVRDRAVDYWATWPKEIKAITTARANEMAKPYCDPAKYDVVVAGDKSKVLKELKPLGLEVIELNRDGHPLTTAAK